MRGEQGGAAVKPEPSDKAIWDTWLQCERGSPDIVATVTAFGLALLDRGRADAEERTYTVADVERLSRLHWDADKSGLRWSETCPETRESWKRSMVVVLAELGFKPTQDSQPNEAPNAHEAAKPAPGVVAPGEPTYPVDPDAKGATAD